MSLRRWWPERRSGGQRTDREGLVGHGEEFGFYPKAMK